MEKPTGYTKFKPKRAAYREILFKGFPHFMHDTPPGHGCAMERSADRSTFA